MLDVASFPTLRACISCAHWNRTATVASEHGYLEALCRQPKDGRDWTLKRGSETCGNWERGSA